MDAFSRAATNRSLRTIQTELDFLLDAAVLTPAQVSQIAAILPAAPATSAAAAARNSSPSARAPSIASSTAAPAPLRPIVPISAVPSLPSPAPAASPISPKAAHVPEPVPTPPPAYASEHGLAAVEALYHYRPSDAGDLALAPGERVAVLEWMNADWARGRSERSGAEGIFPRSYVRVLEADAKGRSGSTYGNMPLDVANGSAVQGQNGQNGQNGQQGESQFNAQGKKFGKKLGNAAIFGAGATLGSNVVNSIF